MKRNKVNKSDKGMKKELHLWDELLPGSGIIHRPMYLNDAVDFPYFYHHRHKEFPHNGQTVHNGNRILSD
jgi:hypothetical protein